MQDHVKLEVALEIVMAKIAETIFNLSKADTKENNDLLDVLLKYQDEAYKGNFYYINKILEGDYNG